MPLVFVHGVTVRDSPEYREDVKARDTYFQRLVLEEIVADATNATILNPLWGKYGAKFRWRNASLPSNGVEALGAEDFIPALLLAEEGIVGASTRTVLLEVAKRSIVDVVDILWAAEAPFLKGKDAIDFAEQAIPALDYAQHNPAPEWLPRTRNDTQLVRNLLNSINEWTAEVDDAVEVLGSPTIRERAKEGAARLTGAFGRGAGAAVVTVGRSAAHRKTALFLGDVFEYLERRGTPSEPGAIPDTVITALEEGYAKVKGKDDKLVVVAHSMGGNIVYDILTYFLPHSHPDLHVDVLVTVGSQVGLFEELKLFGASIEAIPDSARPKVPRLNSVGSWLNVYDTNDILGFAAARIFDGVKDLEYSTGKGIFGAHVTYFLRPSFYARLGARLRKLARP